MFKATAKFYDNTISFPGENWNQVFNKISESLTDYRFLLPKLNVLGENYKTYFIGDCFYRELELQYSTKKKALLYITHPIDVTEDLLIMYGNYYDITNVSLLALHKKDVSNKISVQIKLLTGKTLNFLMSRQSLVIEIKEMLLKEENISIEQQRLIFERKSLKDSETLLDSGIDNNSVVTLILRLRAGMYHFVSGYDDTTGTFELPKIKVENQLYSYHPNWTVMELQKFLDAALDSTHPQSTMYSNACKTAKKIHQKEIKKKAKELKERQKRLVKEKKALRIFE